MTDSGKMFGPDSCGEKPKRDDLHSQDPRSEHPRNDLVKECLLTALVQLLHHEPLEQISITELCARAGVSRMSFYRCYSSKQDVLTGHVDDLFTGYLERISKIRDLSIRSFTLGFCTCWHGDAAFIEVLIERDLSFMLMDKFIRYLGMLFGTLVFADGRQNISHYEVSYRAGALYAVLIDWARNGFRESDEDIARLIETLSEGYHARSE